MVLLGIRRKTLILRIKMDKKDQKNEDRSIGYQADTINVFNGASPKNKSIIAEVVNILSGSCTLESFPLDSSPLPSKVEEKIIHNNVNRCRHIIETYKDNVIDLGYAYKTIEELRPGRHQKLLHIISRCYKNELGKLFDDGNFSQEKIRQNSDQILENIMHVLREKTLESSNLNAENEDVDIAIGVIVADAFISCVVLENSGGAV